MDYTDRQRAFLVELQKLCEKYEASICGGGYEDNYLEISIKGEPCITFEDTHSDYAMVDANHPHLKESE